MSPLLAIAAALALSPVATAAPSVRLVTMGPGDDVFSRFGHAALCVSDAPDALGRCYNYGTADFTTPLPLSAGVLRGQAQFWVSEVDEDRMMLAYRHADRTLYVQRLPLDDEAAAALEAALVVDALPENRFYLYDHFDDNCTTRLRDHLDRATGGALSAGADAPSPPSLRDVIRAHLAASPGLVIAAELLVGREVDRVPTIWEAMFLPAVLREEVRVRLGVEPEVVYTRRTVDPAVGSARALTGLWVGAGALGLLLAALRSRATVGLALGGLALVPWGLAIYSPLPELRDNELLLVLCPLDALWALSPARLARWWPALRLVGLALVAVGLGLGMLRQELGPALSVVALAMVGAALRTRRKAAHPVIESPLPPLAAP